MRVCRVQGLRFRFWTKILTCTHCGVGCGLFNIGVDTDHADRRGKKEGERGV